MTYEFLHSVFPNYTKEMYIGNEPKQFHPHINGDLIEEYDDYPNNGQAHIYNGELIYGDYKLAENTTCFICNGVMQIIYNDGESVVSLRIVGDGQMQVAARPMVNNI